MSPLLAAQWFTETPWPPIVLLSVLAALAFIGWMGTRRGTYLVAVTVIAVICGGIVLLERSIVTESEIVPQRLHALAAAFQARNLDEALSFFSENATRERARLRAAMMYPIEFHGDLSITDTQVELTAQNSRATSHFRASGNVELQDFGPQWHTSRWLFNWQKEGGQWRIIHIQQLEPITGAPVDLWLRIPGV